LGFSFVELGTVTPTPQPGNPRPRLYRLIEDEAIINRMGFNNEGHEALRRRLEARRSRGGIAGVNIGANKDATDRVGDYVRGIDSAGSAFTRIEAGASLLQLYSALVFKGPSLIAEILDGLAERMAASGLASLEEAVGCKAKSYQNGAGI